MTPYAMLPKIITMEDISTKARCSCIVDEAAPFLVSLGVAVATKTPVSTSPVSEGEPLSVAEGGKVAVIEMGTVPAVSYTHLTLPTKA